MANWQGMILTTKGRALQAKVEAGITKLMLTKIKLGDGAISGSQTLESLTDLVSPKQIIGITTINPQNNGICKITGTVTNVDLDTGYNIKELGIFATDPDAGEILYAITTDSNFDYLQAQGGATIVSQEFNLSITISNASQVTATIDATGLLTVSSATVLISQMIATHNTAADAHKAAFDVHNTDTDAHADIREALKKAGGMPLGSIMPFLMKAPPAGWLALDTGALVSRATYPDLWTWVQTNAPLLSETDWQAQAAAQSSVGAYSTGDGSTTFRLPKILDYVRGGLTADAGTWQGDAMQGHAHNVNRLSGTGTNYTWQLTSTAAFGGAGTGDSGTAAITTNTISDGNGTPRTASETRPKTVKFLYCVKTFDAETNQSLIDVTALANDVNNLKTQANKQPEIYVYTISTSHTANTTLNSNVISISGDFSDVYVGQTVTGTGIPANTTVTAVNKISGAVTLSNNATAAATGVSITFTKADGIFTHTIPAGKTSCEVTVTGGGGGGAVGNAGGYGCSSGAAAGTAIKNITGLKSGDVVAVTVGTCGLAPSSTGNGTNGGTSSFGAYCSATGGGGGKYTAAGNATAAGGIGIGGDINVGGGDSYSYNIQSDGDDYFTGGCPSSYWGGGQAAGASSPGTPAFGTGGRNGSAGVIGQGGQGIVVVKYY